MTVRAKKAPAKKARAKAEPRKKTVAELRRALEDQPLVGLVEAARILKIRPPNVSRLRSQGRMPEGIEVAGSAAVYVRSEVEALAAELAAERS